MEILTDNHGAAWRITGDLWQVTVSRRYPLTQEDVSKGLTLEDKAWRRISYHNRLDQALGWLLDVLVRQDLESTTREELGSAIESWRTKLQSIAEYWRASMSKSTYERSFTEE